MSRAALLLLWSSSQAGAWSLSAGLGPARSPLARPGGLAWRRVQGVQLAAQKEPEEAEEEGFTFDAAERARQLARANYETMLGAETEEDIRRLVFDYDPDIEELPVPSEGLMADDSVIPDTPQQIAIKGDANKNEFALDSKLNVDMGSEGTSMERPLPMAGPSSPDVKVESADMTISLEGDLVLGQDAGGTLNLPDFDDFKRKQAAEAEKAESEPSPVAVLRERTRQNVLDQLELDPFADSDFDRFKTEEYGLISALIGEGSRPFIGIPLPYLQTGHSVLLLIVLVCTFLDVPGNPLTELPGPIREFLGTGLTITYTINVGVAALAFNAAGTRKQPRIFWALKAFLLGGLALKELTEIQPVPASKR